MNADSDSCSALQIGCATIFDSHVGVGGVGVGGAGVGGLGVVAVVVVAAVVAVGVGGAAASTARRGGWNISRMTTRRAHAAGLSFRAGGRAPFSHEMVCKSVLQAHVTWDLVSTGATVVGQPSS